MTFKKLLLVFIICSPMLLIAQNKIDYQSIDSSTYILYINKDWKSLIQTSKLGLKNGIDYYYLRMRKGIASFESAKYLTSNSDFEKAVEFNRYDKIANEYLYYSLLRSGRLKRATKLASGFPPSWQNEWKTKNKPLGAFNIEAGYIFSNNKTKNGNLYLMGNDSLYGRQTLYDDQYYLHAGLTFNAGQSVSVYAGYTFMQIQKTTRFQYTTFPLERIDRIYYPDGYENIYDTTRVFHEEFFDNTITQNEIYLSGHIQFDKGWALNIFGKVLLPRVQNIFAFYDTISRTDTVAYNSGDDNYTLFNYTEGIYSFQPSDTLLMNWLAGFNLEKDWNIIVLNIFSSYSFLNNISQYQTGLSATYYPLGNTTFYGKSGLLFFFEPEAPLYRDASRLLFEQKIGVRLAKRYWIEGSFITGGLQNTNLSDGFVVYNIPEEAKYKAGINLFIFASEKLEISLMYSYLSKLNKVFTYQAESNNMLATTYKYQTQSIIGGIKWRF